MNSESITEQGKILIGCFEEFRDQTKTNLQLDDLFTALNVLAEIEIRSRNSRERLRARLCGMAAEKQTLEVREIYSRLSEMQNIKADLFDAYSELGRAAIDIARLKFDLKQAKTNPDAQ